jgi:hypothetical protein
MHFRVSKVSVIGLMRFLATPPCCDSCIICCVEFAHQTTFRGDNKASVQSDGARKARWRAKALEARRRAKPLVRARNMLDRAPTTLELRQQQQSQRAEPDGDALSQREVDEVRGRLTARRWGPVGGHAVRLNQSGAQVLDSPRD